LTHEGDSARVTGLGTQRRGDAEVLALRDHRAVRPVAYLVLPNTETPFLLARVRWPDVYQAISAVRTDWQDDPGLFDLPYAPASVHISYEEASVIAEEWGAHIPPEDAAQEWGPSLIRRMPSNWSDLSTAERRAWSVEIEKPARHAVAIAASRTFTGNTIFAPVSPTQKKRRWRRRREPLVIDLTAAEALHAKTESK
jgi:hypothetical protein